MIRHRSNCNFFRCPFHHRDVSRPPLSSASRNCCNRRIGNATPHATYFRWSLIFFLLTVALGDSILPPINEEPNLALESSGTQMDNYSFANRQSDRHCWREACNLIKLVPKVGSTGSATLGGIGDLLKVVCKPKVTVSVDQLCLSQLPAETRILEIHNTTSNAIEASSFLHLQNLRKLDLRYNHVSHVEPNAFAELSNLRRLDLSHNQITELNTGHLKGLQQLVRLKLSNNPLRKIDVGIVEEAPSLKAIELSNTQLHCDCNLRWLVSGGENGDGKQLLRILGTPVCHSPVKLNGKKLKKLKAERLICDHTDLVVTKSMVELEPGVDQVVFAGDSLRMRCRIGESGTVAWKRGETFIHDGMPKGANKSMEVNVKTVQSNDNVESFIEIPEVSWGHSGEWTCIVDGKKETNSKSVSIYVIHHHTKYCPLNVTTDNKGTYTWPRTVANVRVDLPCQALSHYPSWSHNTTVAKRATNFCNENGRWQSPNTSNCSYVLETTRILEHFSKTDLDSAKASVQESSNALRNFTRNGHVLKDPMDVVFLTRTIEKYIALLTISPENQQTARTLMEIIAATLSADKGVLQVAEASNESCSSLVNSLWNLGKFLPYFSIVSTPNFSFNQISFKPEAFGEVSCVWFRKRLYSSDRSFHCGVNNSSLFYTIAEDITDARIRIPTGMFRNSTDNSSEVASVTLQFIAFDSAKLFVSSKANWEVTSPVLGVRLVSEGGRAVNGSVYITLRSTLYGQNVIPARWSNGSWSEDGCTVIRVINSMVFFQCRGLSEYGLLQDVSDLLQGAGMKGAPFKSSPIGLYVGSALCNVLLMASIAIWCIHHQRIGTQNKNKHSYVNTWMALLFLNSLFTVGIYQTESADMCKIIGLILHYLTICVLLWIIVSVTNLYKKISKSFRPPVPNDDADFPAKPMFRFYLVGWGIALILCGISTAVNLDHYSTYHYCFLSWSPSLAAFYAPCVILVFILVAFFLLTHCLLKAGHEGYSENTGNTETTELELLDTISPSSENPPSLRADDDELSVFSQKSVLSVADSQHSPMTQLKAHVVTLLLFILTWASAAMTTASPFAMVIPHHELIFSLIYAACAVSLGVFVFMFFCACRTDVTECCREWSLNCWRSKEKASSMVANNIFNTFPPNSATVQANNQMESNSSAAAASVRSLGSGQHSVTNKSSSVVCSVSRKEDATGKVSNVVNLLNLSVMADGVQYAPEMFYNPKQSGVARRFFMKQRLRQMRKRNNLEMARPVSDCNSSTVYRVRSKQVGNNSESDVSSFDPSCLGVQSNKINNTNIHVDAGEYYLGSKHPSKSPTPELLCVFGPPKEACNIVHTGENNQHLWPIASHQLCGHRKNQKNRLQSNCYPSDDVSLSGEDSGLLVGDRPSRLRYQPIAYGKKAHPALASNESNKEDNSAGSTDDPADKFNYKKRHRKLVHRPDRSRRAGTKTCVIPRETGEIESSNYTDNDNHSSCANVDKRSIGDGIQASFSPLSFSSLPCPTSCLGTPSSISPSSRHADGFSPVCSQLDWMHLIKKRVLQNEKYRRCDPDLETGDTPNEEYSCDYDDDQWTRDVSPYATTDLGYAAAIQSDVDTTSIATSLIPAVDTSPPGSVVVSESPFDSPLHNLHQNTPDRASLDSDFRLSPSQLSSRDSPELLNVTPTRECASFNETTDCTVTPTRSVNLLASEEHMLEFDHDTMFSNVELIDFSMFDEVSGMERNSDAYKSKSMKKSSSFSTTSTSRNTVKMKPSSSLDMSRQSSNSD